MSLETLVAERRAQRRRAQELVLLTAATALRKHLVDALSPELVALLPNLIVYAYHITFLFGGHTVILRYDDVEKVWTFHVSPEEPVYYEGSNVWERLLDYLAGLPA